MVEQKPEPDSSLTITVDEEFDAAVREGLADIAAGRTVDLQTFEAELRQIIYGKA